MTDPFILAINYKGKELPLTAQLIMQGYSHKFKVLVNDMEVYFEPDEEGTYRAVMMPGQDEEVLLKTDPELLSLIAQKIAAVLA